MCLYLLLSSTRWLSLLHCFLNFNVMKTRKDKSFLQKGLQLDIFYKYITISMSRLCWELYRLAWARIWCFSFTPDLLSLELLSPEGTISHFSCHTSLSSQNSSRRVPRNTLSNPAHQPSCLTLSYLTAQVAFTISKVFNKIFLAESLHGCEKVQSFFVKLYCWFIPLLLLTWKKEWCIVPDNYVHTEWTVLLHITL